MHERITFKCSGVEHNLSLSQADKRLLSLIGQQVSAQDLEVLQNVFLRSFRNRAKVLPRSEVAHAVEEAVRALEHNGDSLSYMYSFTIKTGFPASTGAGAVSGIRMPGDDSSTYLLKAGLGFCDLQRRGTNAEGGGFIIESIDCRDRTKLATENCGEIIIKRRKMNLSLPVLFKELRTKLVEQDCADVLLSYEEVEAKN